MQISTRTVDILNDVSFGLNALAIILTIFRLWYRIFIRRFWWEDAWAAFALMWGITFFTTLLLYSTCSDTTTYIVSYWVNRFSFTCTLWTSRMSIVFSVVRITPDSLYRRRITIGIVGLFTLLWAGLLIQKACLCGLSSGWNTECHLLMPMVIFEFVSDCISDAILVAIPLRLLWNVKLPVKQRRMIISLFSSSIVISLSSVFHAVTQIAKNYDLMYPAANVEVANSLIVCNLLVIVTSVYRVMRKDTEDSDSSNSENSSSKEHYSDSDKRTTSRSVEFTTVDLNRLTGENGSFSLTERRSSSMEVTTSSAKASVRTTEGIP